MLFGFGINTTIDAELGVIACGGATLIGRASVLCVHIIGRVRFGGAEFTCKTCNCELQLQQETMQTSQLQQSCVC